MKRISILLLAIGLTGFGCEKSSQGTPESVQPAQFVFGSYFGMCVGDKCVQFYKLEDGKLFEDTKKVYPLLYNGEAYQGEYEERDADDFALVKDLPESLPEELFEEEEMVLGIPDAGDWGGLYVARRLENGDLDWRYIDNNDQYVPEYLHGFMEDLRAAIGRLQ